MTTIIKASGISKQYKIDKTTFVQALEDINIEIKQGEFVCVMGASGSGKSTLIQILTTIDKPTKGTLSLDGRSKLEMQYDLSDFRYQNLGFVFQDLNLLDEYTVFENIALPVLMRDGKNKSMNDYVIQLANKLGIESLLYKYPTECSGGEQQRIAIARALVNHPKILVADEPTGNLDSITVKAIMNVFRSLNQEGTTILMVTHDSYLASYSDRMLHLKSGKIVDEIAKQNRTQEEYFNKITEINSKHNL
ncbi:ABC transporter ATP-binding protein [Beduini massiliensis]|uniref:ABC transporter ATP-binding protein n=1 Tax=Beduini massiliensis TaxID=1585974 RepID=UPI00059A922D|nr:ABC transporter ATP-binding protein [Beduini massiliensis]